MVDRLANKMKSPESRGDESYDRGKHAMQVCDGIENNALAQTRQGNVQPSKTNEIFTAIAAGGSAVIFDSAKTNKYGKVGHA